MINASTNLKKQWAAENLTPKQPTKKLLKEGRIRRRIEALREELKLQREFTLEV